MIGKSNLIRHSPIPDKLIAIATANRNVNNLPSVSSNESPFISPVKSIHAIAQNILQEIFTPFVAITTTPNGVVCICITTDDELLIDLFEISQELNNPLRNYVFIFIRKNRRHKSNAIINITIDITNLYSYIVAIKVLQQ
jgi:hypothetical protein